MWTILAFLMVIEKDDLGPVSWKQRQYIEKKKKEKEEKIKMREDKILRFLRLRR